MRFVRRVVLPVALAVIAVGAGTAAVVRDGGEATASGAGEPATTVTPVLSARRVPELLTAPAADLTLRLRLIEQLATAPPDSCLVVEAGGRDIVAHQGDLPLVPASIQKTLVASALLDTLPPDHRFSTEVRAEAVDGAGVVQGDAWLVGSGDPQLSTDDYAQASVRQDVARTALEDLADEVAAAGVTRISGRLVADESRYDTSRGLPSWRPDPTLTPGPLSALSVNDGFESFPSAADPGGALTPTSDPARLAAANLAFLLAERGITIDGGVATGAAPAAATPVAAVESPPLSEIVGQMLAYSDNQTAELLIKELGVQVEGAGTTAAGAAALARVLTDLGLDVSGATFVDGSGLSDTNEATCELLVGALSEAGADSPVVGGLAIAGESGTLANSFEGTAAEGRLRGKTGSLNDVTAFAGIVADDPEDAVVFSLVINRPPFVEQGDLDLRTRIGLVLSDYPQRPPLDQVEPRPVAG